MNSEIFKEIYKIDNSNYKLFGKNQVKVKIPKASTKTNSGIYTSAESEGEIALKTTKGVVVEVSNSLNNDIVVSIGEIVAFRPYSGINIEGDDGFYYRILDCSEIHSKYIQSYFPNKEIAFDKLTDRLAEEKRLLKEMEEDNIRNMRRNNILNQQPEWAKQSATIIK